MYTLKYSCRHCLRCRQLSHCCCYWGHVMPGLGTPKVNPPSGQLPAGGWPGERAGWLAARAHPVNFRILDHAVSRASILKFQPNDWFDSNSCVHAVSRSRDEIRRVTRMQRMNRASIQSYSSCEHPVSHSRDEIWRVTASKL